MVQPNQLSPAWFPDEIGTQLKTRLKQLMIVVNYIYKDMPYMLYIDRCIFAHHLTYKLYDILSQICNLLQEKHCNTASQPISEEMLYSVLGLVMNMAFDGSELRERYSVELCEMCMGLVTCGQCGVEERALAVLGQLLPQHDAAINTAVNLGLVPKLTHILNVRSLSLIIRWRDKQLANNF